MKYARFLAGFLPQVLLLATTLTVQPARADDYADVSQLLRAGKLADALSKADAFLGSQPKDAQMRFLKGVIQRESGKTSDAIATFSRLTEDYPELPEPFNNLAVLYATQGQYDRARTALEMAMHTNPSYATAHDNLGDVYAKLASQAYSKALQLDNNTAPSAPPAPKLALIRELYPANSSRLARVGQGNVLALAPPATNNAAAKPAPLIAAPAKPAPSAPPPVPAPATPAVAAASRPATALAANTPPAHAAPAAPVASTPVPAPAAVPAAPAANHEVETTLRSWASAWSARDVKGYLGFYAKTFSPPGKLSRSAWEDERRQRISSKSSISVKLESLNVSVSGANATARFKQDYRANGLVVSSRKVLTLTKTGERWLIVSEAVGN